MDVSLGSGKEIDNFCPLTILVGTGIIGANLDGNPIEKPTTQTAVVGLVHILGSYDFFSHLLQRVIDFVSHIEIDIGKHTNVPPTRIVRHLVLPFPDITHAFKRAVSKSREYANHRRARVQMIKEMK
jgi:hypothetical protein